MRKIRDVLGHRNLFVMLIRKYGKRRSFTWLSLIFAQTIPFMFLTYLLFTRANGDIKLLINSYHIYHDDLFYLALSSTVYITFLGSVADAFMAIFEELLDNQNKIMGVVAHDLRGPLSSIEQMAEILKNSGETSKDDFRVIANQMVNSSQYLIGLTNDLLDMSMIKSGEIAVNMFDQSLHSIISEQFNTYVPLYKSKQVSLKYVHDNNDIFVCVDRYRLGQALGNLLSNALKFSHKGQTVTIKVRPTSEGMVSITVNDEGIGMEEKQLAKLFTPFQKGRSGTANEKSSGLGLFITKKIIESHHGSIIMKSSPNQGTLVEILLPAHRQENLSHITNVDQTSTSLLSGKLSDQKVKVLVVDDSDEVLTVFKLWVKSLSYIELRTVASSLDAKHINPNDFDIVLLDYHMPEASGVDLIKYWKEQYSPVLRCKIIGLSGSTQSSERDDFISAGVTSVLLKPLSKSKFIEFTNRELEDMAKAS